MKLVTYLNNRLQTLASEISHKGPTTFRGAEADALQFVFSVYRFVFAGFFVLIVFVKYALTTCKILKAPMPELDMLRAADQAEKLARDRRLGRKVGVQPTSKIGSH